MQAQPSDPNDLPTRELNAEDAGSKIWNQLLESTLVQRARSLSTVEWSLLCEVARKFDGGQSTLEEFVVELVETFLSNRFPATVSTAEYLKQMSRSIGQTLCSDPLSRQRLVDFHQHLRGMNCGI
jgi:hypothetical protein